MTDTIVLCSFTKNPNWQPNIDFFSATCQVLTFATRMLQDTACRTLVEVLVWKHRILHPFWRVFLNLWFAKPMVWVRVAFHENDGNRENDENDEDNSDSYKQGVECWIRGNHGNHENDENHENPGCKPRVPQTIGLEIPDFWPPKMLHFSFCLCNQPGVDIATILDALIENPAREYRKWSLWPQKALFPCKNANLTNCTHFTRPRGGCTLPKGKHLLSAFYDTPPSETLS